MTSRNLRRWIFAVGVLAWCTFSPGEFRDRRLAASQDDVVIYASDVSTIFGGWTKVTDSTAAGGVRLTSTDNAAAIVEPPLATPTHYFDATFQAPANVPYRLWLRLRAKDNSKYNESVWVQFSDSRVNGSSAYALNSTSGILVNLATDASASSLSGWGWQNTAYWLTQTTVMTFASTGAHTVRIQVREDGAQIDQIVLSPQTYLNASPGLLTNDNTVVPKPAGNVPPLVSLSAPINGASYVAPANITLTASASDSDGIVSVVEFYSGATLIGTDTSDPYSVTWSNVAAGSATMTTVARDNSGESTTSLPVTVTIQQSASTAANIVVYAADVTSLFGEWTKVSDATAAGGLRLTSADNAAAIVDPALATPTHYFDATFDAPANTPYTFWMRLKAKDNSKFNDSVWVQFSDAQVNGFPVYPLNSTSGLLVNLATDASATSLNGWGWQNTVYWLTQATTMTFASAGTHTVRVQIREDGPQIDQILLSPQTYLNAAPGPVTNDTTIVPKPSGNVPPTVTLTAPANGASFSAPANITLTANASDTDGTVALVDFYAGTTLIGTDTSSPYNITWSNVPVGTATLSAVAQDNNGGITTSPSVLIVVNGSGQQFPTPWTSVDVGNVGLVGSATFDAGVFTIQGAGVDIWETSDSFRFVSQPWSGDGAIVVRVTTQQNTHAFAKVGVMLRDGVGPSARHVMLDVLPDGSIEFMQRATLDGTTTWLSGDTVAYPAWLRLTRTGQNVAAAISTDGLSWSVLSSVATSLPSTVNIGVVVLSHDTSLLNTAIVDHVSVGSSTSNTAPSVAVTRPSNGATYIAPATLDLRASAMDVDGSIGRVDFYEGSTLLGTDSAAPFTMTWQNVAAGSRLVTAVAIDSQGATTTSSPVTITVIAPGGQLPAPWTTQDIGNVGLAGAAAFQSGAFAVEGAGADIWSTADSFRYVSQPLSGDGQIVARVVNQDDTHTFAKSGVMMRDGLGAGAAHVSLTVRPEGDVEMLQRSSMAFGGPTTPPGATASAGTGIPSGIHNYAYTWVTTVGESLPSPLRGITNGPLTPSAVPPVGNPFVGQGLGLGSYTYAMTFLNGAGETPPATTSITTTRDVPNPTAAPAVADDFCWCGGSMDLGETYNYAYTYSDSSGRETLRSPGTPYVAHDWGQGPGGWSQGVRIDVPVSFDQAVQVIRLYRTTGNGGTYHLIEQHDNATWNNSFQDTRYDPNIQDNVQPPATSTMVLRSVALTVPIGPTGTTARRIYRTAAGGSQLKLIKTISNNISTQDTDTTPDGSLGVVAPTTNTAAVNQGTLSGILLGPSGTTARRLYRTAAGGSQLRLVTTIGDNTTTIYTDAVTDALLGINAPTADSSGLTSADGSGGTNFLAGKSNSLPTWLRLTRAGSTITGWVSNDGATWTTVGVTSTSLSTTIIIGMAVTSHDVGRLNTATFDNVSATGATCYSGISPSSVRIDATGAVQTVSVLAGPGCAWAATSQASWLHITTGQEAGTGNGSVQYTVDPNVGAATRIGSLTLAGNIFQVTQNGAGTCTYTTSPQWSELSSAGGSGVIAIATGGACGWVASTQTSWITLVGQTSGTGSGQVAYSAATNGTGVSRTGTIAIADQVATVAQTNVCAAPTAPVFSPLGGSYTGGSVTVSVAASDGTATVRYTTDGSDPTATSSAYAGSVVLGPGTTTLKSRAFTSCGSSSVTSATYVITGTPLPTPYSTPSAGTYSSQQSVALVVSDPLATIRYTTDGSDPTESSVAYGSALAINGTTILKARAYRSGYSPSLVYSATFAFKAPSPVFSPPGGDINSPSPIAVQVTSALAGAAFYYTLDRSTPTSNSFQACDQCYVYVPYGGTLKVLTTRQGYQSSDVVTDTYFGTNVVPTSSPVVAAVSAAISSAFNRSGTSVFFQATGGYFSTNPNDTRVTINGAVVRATTTSSGVQVNDGLSDGRNDVSVQALDTSGFLVDENATIWGGARTMTVVVVDAYNQPVWGATVVASLVADRTVSFNGTTDTSGRLFIQNLPNGFNIVVGVSAAGYRPAEREQPATANSTTVRLDIDNNDLSQSVAGWTWSNGSNIYTTFHSEASLAPTPCPDCAIRGASLAQATAVSSSTSQQSASTTMFSGGEPRDAGQPASIDTITSSNRSLAVQTLALQSTDMDLLIHNKNSFVPVTTSRAFSVAPGTKEVTVRYRFQSAERMMASPQNDSFDVRLRVLNSTRSVYEYQTVGSLWSQLDSNGATGWRTLTLPILSDNEQVQLDVVVSNVFDNAGVSWVYVDMAQERTYRVGEVKFVELTDPLDSLKALRPAAELLYLSVTTHTYLEPAGITRIYGSLTLEGEADDAVQSVTLEIVDKQTGQMVTAGLTAEGRLALLRPFTGGSISTPGYISLFEVASAQLNAIPHTADGTVDLRVRGRTQRGFDIDFNPLKTKNVQKLVIYENGNRFGGPGRDAVWCELLANDPNPANRPPYLCGGDSWARPSTKTYIEAVTGGVKWNDFSKMHGGRFPPHGGHRHGVDIDGLYDGYRNLDEAAALKMIALLNAFGSRVDQVFVAFKRIDSDPFYRAIKGKTLTNGTPLETIIFPDAGHSKHFHWRLRS